MARGTADDVDESTEVGKKEDQVDPEKPKSVRSQHIISYWLVS